jgi:hypothetical protein
MSWPFQAHFHCFEIYFLSSTFSLNSIHCNYVMWFSHTLYQLQVNTSDINPLFISIDHSNTSFWAHDYQAASRSYATGVEIEWACCCCDKLMGSIWTGLCNALCTLEARTHSSLAENNMILMWLSMARNNFYSVYRIVPYHPNFL